MHAKRNSIDRIRIPAFKDFLGESLPCISEKVKMSNFQGEFPAELKHSTNASIIKDSQADSRNLKNYRPISITPTLAGTFEKAALYQLITFLDENNLRIATRTG